jgi:hypothetical protein
MRPPPSGETIEMVRLVDRLTRAYTWFASQVGCLQRQVQEQQDTTQRLLMVPKEDEPSEPRAEAPVIVGNESSKLQGLPHRGWLRRLLRL